jgi:hypothetical protein
MPLRYRSRNYSKCHETGEVERTDALVIETVAGTDRIALKCTWLHQFRGFLKPRVSTCVKHVIMCVQCCSYTAYTVGYTPGINVGALQYVAAWPGVAVNKSAVGGAVLHFRLKGERLRTESFPARFIVYSSRA